MNATIPANTRVLCLLALVLLIPPLASARVIGAADRVVAATYLGGSGTDYGRAVALDAQGNIYLGGDSFSTSVLGRSLSANGGQDILVAKLSPDATQLLGLFGIGSTSTDRLGGMAVTLPTSPARVAWATMPPRRTVQAVRLSMRTLPPALLTYHLRLSPCASAPSSGLPKEGPACRTMLLWMSSCSRPSTRSSTC